MSGISEPEFLKRPPVNFQPSAIFQPLISEITGRRITPYVSAEETAEKAVETAEAEA